MNLYLGSYKNVVVLLLGGISNFQVTNRKSKLLIMQRSCSEAPTSHFETLESPNGMRLPPPTLCANHCGQEGLGRGGGC